MGRIERLLGAGPPSGTKQITIFIPSVDRVGEPIDQEQWREKALAVLGRLFRGATAFPPGRGVWRDDERGGELVFEEPIMVTSYVSPLDMDDGALRELRKFLHQMGRETNQGEVGVIVDGAYHGITEFDE